MCLNAITYPTKFGYTPEQAYQILGAAPIEGRFSGGVDIPNACATSHVPTKIFGFEIRRRPRDRPSPIAGSARRRGAESVERRTRVRGAWVHLGRVVVGRTP